MPLPPFEREEGAKKTSRGGGGGKKPPEGEGKPRFFSLRGIGFLEGVVLRKGG